MIRATDSQSEAGQITKKTMDNNTLVKWLNANAGLINLKKLGLRIGVSETDLHHVKNGKFAMKDEIREKLVKEIQGLQV